MLKRPLTELMYPPDVVNPTESVKVPTAKTADDINDLFKSLDTGDKNLPVEKKEAKTSKEEVEEDEPAEQDDDELELKDDDEDIEKLDLNKNDDEVGDIEAPPRKKEILKEYPELFKKFPFLEKMMYRDRQYNELFGSFDDAREIAEKSENFAAFENQLLAGNTEEVLKSVKETDEKAFNIIVDDYLPTLAKVDKEAYFHVVGNLNRRLIMEMVTEANSVEKDDPEQSSALKQAALLVNQFVFGNSRFTAPTNRVDKKVESENNEVEQERLSYVQERFESARDDLQTQVDNTLRATIDSYIDPKNAMSGYVKKNAVNDAMKILTASIASDSLTVKNLDKLWRSSFDSKFSRDSLGRIKSFYLSKAKANLKNAIIKARSEALKDLAPKREKETEEEIEETPRKQSRNITPGRSSQPKNKNGIQKGESVTDFFMRD